MRTLIDGYNLLYAFPPLRKLMIARQSLAARKGLVAMIGALMKSGAVKPRVTIVFDGRPNAATAAEADVQGLDVRFAPSPETADALIGDIVESRVPEDQFTVITSDREVAERARRLGAAVIGIKQFIETHVPERTPPKPIDLELDLSGGKPPGDLPDFMVDKWLEEFGLEE